jgi:hypothetical protein
VFRLGVGGGEEKNEGDEVNQGEILFFPEHIRHKKSSGRELGEADDKLEFAVEAVE